MGDIAERVRPNQVVSFRYVLRLPDGKEIDRSGDEPLAYLHGHGGIVPGLEVELEGKSVGEKFEVKVAPADAYGNLQQNSTKTYPKSSFPKNVTVGMQFAVEGERGQTVPVWIREVKSDRVVVDRNHPLAGKTLHFSVEVVGIRAPLPEELAHGHVHGPGDHHHH
ncbi:MAG: peptidylprolyl isomerase [Polyangiaceae bacterium]|nr:peptidylprolyl isomerase [Polyangiaceae bacterium]